MHTLKDSFRALYTIELSPELAILARRRFRQSPHIHILNGDSGQLLTTLLQTITVPCLFWLDGHYSGGVTAQATLDTPILAELQTIFAHPIKTHVILIDDARLFNGTADYPTLDQLKALFAEHRPDYVVTVHNDSIRAHPPGQAAANLLANKSRAGQREDYAKPRTARSAEVTAPRAVGPSGRTAL